MTTTNWTELVVLGEDAETVIAGEERLAALRQLRATGSMHTYLLAALPGQEDLDPSEWGPADEDINWTGFVGERVAVGSDADRETGIVHDVDGDRVEVGFDSGSRAWVALGDCEATTERHSDGHRMS